MSLGREIHDGQSSVTQREPRGRLEPSAGVIGTAMHERIGHDSDDPFDVESAGRHPQTRHAAHQRLPAGASARPSTASYSLTTPSSM